MVLNEKESLSYNGGAKITATFVVIFTAIGSFFLGFFDGYTNPQKCN